MPLQRYHGGAKVDPRHPQAAGICDRCGFRRTLRSLSWQFEWAGPTLANQRILVCESRSCLDIPNEQLRSIVLGPDPLPVPNPRPENFADEENTAITTDDGFVIIADDGTQIISDQ